YPVMMYMSGARCSRRNESLLPEITMSATTTAETTTTKATKSAAPSLRKPQVRLLAALAKAKGPMTRGEMATAAKVDPSTVGDYAGPRPADRTEEAAARFPFPALDELKLVKATDDRPFRYTITAAGRKALAK